MFPCAGVGMLTPRSDWSSHMIARLITSLVPRPSYHGVPVRGPGNNGLRMRLIKNSALCVNCGSMTKSYGDGDVANIQLH